MIGPQNTGAEPVKLVLTVKSGLTPSPSGWYDSGRMLAAVTPSARYMPACVSTASRALRQPGEWRLAGGGVSRLWELGDWV